MPVVIDIVDMKLLEDFAEDMAKLLKPGDVLGLVGEIGAGKTTFTQVLFRSLGVEEKVSSPTFNIVLLYNSPKFRLYHADLYRIDYEEELDNIGFGEMLCDEGVVIVEWADKMEAYLKDYARTYMELEFKVSSETRTVSFDGEMSLRYNAMKGGLPW